MKFYPVKKREAIKLVLHSTLIFGIFALLLVLQAPAPVLLVAWFFLVFLGSELIMLGVYPLYYMRLAFERYMIMNPGAKKLGGDNAVWEDMLEGEINEMKQVLRTKNTLKMLVFMIPCFYVIARLLGG
jgi:hypothetical protein